ncbi:LamG domain-containing protein [Spirilliplanes yamanashiensis]|uniref:LamG-like jellyroll fold domain-containing protein n=1 Tax=Spirilliplanes yamanashiensis TaxID=42233 RepID=A0A8J4DIB2_9ACTN|nr:LamG domain-containing protein [Spirilliplanes yamanashiensis]MDP9819376.1 hypothetical protein [Spirilliplanes yamanashiensis]GIJ01800.1 hypothetical protein Sya03_11520 [Spirilliplanes yamanashiensis]
MLARALRSRPWLVVPVVVLALLAGFPAAYGAFSGSTDGTATWGTAASFPTYPQHVAADGARFHHRSDETGAFRADSAAADSSGNNRPGVYGAPTDGPSTWYRFDDGSGTTAADSSGSVNPGTLANGPAWAGGHLGTGGLSFDGADDVATGAAGAVDTGSSFTVAAWVNPTTAGAHHAVLSQDGNAISGFFLKNDSSGRWEFTTYDTDDILAGRVRVQAPAQTLVNRWTHLAAVYNDPTGEIRLYVDGASVGRAWRGGDWSATGPLVVGAARWGAGTRTDHFAGQIDDVRAYRRALNDTEVAGLAAQPSTWWNFDPVSNTQPDHSGSGNPGSLQGTATFTAGGVTMSGDDHGVGVRPGAHTDRSFTVAASVLPTASTGVLAVASQPGAAASAFSLTSNAGAWQFGLTGADTSSPATAVATGTTPATANVTAHVAGVYSDEADEIRIYVDGRLEDVTTATADWDAPGPLNVGRLLSGGSYSGLFQGRINDLKVYPRALASDDVHDLANAPVARYDFEQDSTAVAYDGSGNGHTLTRPSGTTTWWPSAQRGGAMNFSTDGYLRSSGPVLDTSTSYSVSAWVYLTSNAAWNRTAVSQDGANTSAFTLRYNNWDSGNAWAFQLQPSDSTAGPSTAVSGAGSATMNRWTHLAGVYDDGADQIRLYVNGALAATAAATADFAATGSLNLGSSLYDGLRGDFWPGHLDGVAVYQEVLTAADVAALHGQAPVLRWDVNEGTGTNLGDRSGNNNNGTMANGATWAAGRDSNAVSFDGVDDQVTTVAAPVRTDTGFSVSLWAYPASTSATRIAASQNGTYGYAYALGIAGGKWVFSMSAGDSSSPTVISATSAATPVVSTWTHLTAVYDDTEDRIRLYVNGVLDGGNTVTTDWHAAGPMVLGWARAAGASTHRFQGRVDEVYAFRRPLNDIEAGALSGLYATRPLPHRPHTPGMTARFTGALQGAQQGQQGSTAVAFNGFGNAYNPVASTNPAPFTVEAWFRTAAKAGGAIFGFSVNPAGTGGQRDRLLYVDSGGRITLGVYPGIARTIRSPGAYTDGAWHHVAASVGPAGMKLHVDGALVVSDPAVTAAENFTGYWRWGGADLGGWPDRPASDYFVGALDEVAVYPTQLTDQQVARHHAANH